MRWRQRRRNAGVSDRNLNLFPREAADHIAHRG
jgi:hypothetical protein